MFKLLENLKNNVYKNPNRIAYKINNEKITYKRLWNEANNLAESLISQGNSPVIIYGHKSIEMIVSILACLISNRAYVPVDVYNPISRIKEIIQSTKATLIIKNENIKTLIEDENIEVLTISEINKKYFSNQAKFDTSKNETAYIIFTSGSTGKPKGVPITYENLNNFFEWINKIIPNDKARKMNIMNQASYSFDLSVVDIYYSLFNGNTLIGVDRETQNDLSKVINIISKEKINIMVMTPTYIKMLLLDKEFNSKNYKSIETMYFCGEQLEVVTAEKILERFENIKLINAYGPTEATSAVIGVQINKEMLSKKYLPVGDINKSAVEIKIENDEIVLKGKSVFNGYLSNEKGGFYKEDFKDINCYKTGDIGYIENDLLYCVGRKDSQVKYMGYRIELGDIENNLLKIDEIKEAVIIPKYDKNTNIVKGLKAFITLKKQVEIEEIKSQLKKIIPNYMIPKNFVILDEMPKNENGKYDRKKLKEI